MKTLIVSAFAFALLGSSIANAAIVVRLGGHHHHRPHRVCYIHHHHRVCSWR